jgi:thiol-disulfide isomerase/thioredoxin
MKIRKPRRNTIIFLLIITLFIIPQTRQPIQVAFHKVISNIFSVDLIESSERVTLKNYNWKLTDESQHSFDFNTTKNRVIVINFWATWCPPCIAEMPSLQALYNDYKEKVVFLYVTNDDFEIVKAFQTKKNFEFKVYSSKSEIPDEFKTRSIPRTFIINKKGEIVVDESIAIDWNSETVRRQLDLLLSD